jgi:hypothetical protein
MNIFICRSGTWGKKAAQQIKEWLCEDVLKDVLKDFGDMFVSENIAKGAIWSGELGHFLKKACAVLVCLTPDALRSPWVHYEVGAIANLRARPAPVFTLLLGVKAGEIEGPLAAFQSTSADDAKDMRRLIDAITLTLPVGQQTTLWRDRLNERWPETWAGLHERPKRLQYHSWARSFQISIGYSGARHSRSLPSSASTRHGRSDTMGPATPGRNSGSTKRPSNTLVAPTSPTCTGR